MLQNCVSFSRERKSFLDFGCDTEKSNFMLLWALRLIVFLGYMTTVEASNTTKPVFGVYGAGLWNVKDVQKTIG